LCVCQTIQAERMTQAAAAAAAAAAKTATTAETMISPKFFLRDWVRPSTDETPSHQQYLRVCAPFPACDPSGCLHEKVAPIMCGTCNVPLTVLYLVFLCLAMITIVTVNVIVIVVILRTKSLRKRYGYIKVSLATSDLLMGAFALPSAIGNFVKTIFYSESGSWTDGMQSGTFSSSFFGSIVIISLTTSVYNLLLLSFDRWLAVSYPLKASAGKYFTNKKLCVCIGAVWMIGALLSFIPVMDSRTYTYSMDPTTFFYSQSLAAVGKPLYTDRLRPYFSLFVLGIPYIAIVIFNVVTLYKTKKNLRISDKISYNQSSYSRQERKERMKAVLNSYPEMEYSRSRSQSWYQRITESIRSGSNRISSVLRSSQSRKSRSVKVSERITRMIITMVGVFTVCVCPYFIIVTMASNQLIDCSAFGVPYLVACCLLVANSACNFFIYNAWHCSFRIELRKMFKRNRNSSKSSYEVNEIEMTTGNKAASRGRNNREDFSNPTRSSNVAYTPAASSQTFS